MIPHILCHPSKHNYLYHASSHPIPTLYRQHRQETLIQSPLIHHFQHNHLQNLKTCHSHQEACQQKTLDASFYAKILLKMFHLLEPASPFHVSSYLEIHPHSKTFSSYKISHIQICGPKLVYLETIHWYPHILMNYHQQFLFLKSNL